SATLAPSLSLDGSALGNTADLLSYRSLDETDLENPEVRTYSGPEASRTVTPSFPDLVPSKAPTGSEIAYADEPFGWTVTVDNQGGTARDVTVVDTLPANWSYVADSAEVWVDGVSYSLEPEIDTSGSNTVLTWPAA